MVLVILQVGWENLLIFLSHFEILRWKALYRANWCLPVFPPLRQEKIGTLGWGRLAYFLEFSCKLLLLNLKRISEALKNMVNYKRKHFWFWNLELTGCFHLRFKTFIIGQTWGGKYGPLVILGPTFVFLLLFLYFREELRLTFWKAVSFYFQFVGSVFFPLICEINLLCQITCSRYWNKVSHLHSFIHSNMHTQCILVKTALLGRFNTRFLL